MDPSDLDRPPTAGWAFSSARFDAVEPVTVGRSVTGLQWQTAAGQRIDPSLVVCHDGDAADPHDVAFRAGKAFMCAAWQAGTADPETAVRRAADQFIIDTYRPAGLTPVPPAVAVITDRAQLMVEIGVDPDDLPGGRLPMVDGVMVGPAAVAVVADQLVRHRPGLLAVALGRVGPPGGGQHLPAAVHANVARRARSHVEGLPAVP